MTGSMTQFYLDKIAVVMCKMFMMHIYFTVVLILFPFVENISLEQILERSDYSRVLNLNVYFLSFSESKFFYVQIDEQLIKIFNKKRFYLHMS